MVKTVDKKAVVDIDNKINQMSQLVKNIENRQSEILGINNIDPADYQKDEEPKIFKETVIDP